MATMKPEHKRKIAFFIGLVVANIFGGIYMAGYLFSAIMWGAESTPGFSNFFMIFEYWGQWYQFVEAQGGSIPNKFTFADSYYSYLLLSTATPFFIFFIMAFLFYPALGRYVGLFKKKQSLHGDARWGSKKDIENANLRSKKGMLLGQDKNGRLVADGFQHTLLFAPTGSGKGVGFVIPNLLFWQDSVFVHDIKLENYELTSGWRKKQGQDVYLWNPASPDGVTHCYNPLDWISREPGRCVDDVQKISSLLLPKQEFWTNEARSLLVGIMLYLLAEPTKPKTFGEVVRTTRSDNVAKNLGIAMDTMGGDIHPVGIMNLSAFLNKSDKERSGVVSTLNSAIELWTNPFIDAATSKSDFNIGEFKRKPSTVYVGLTPDNIQRLRPLMQVFYQQATEILARNMPTKEDKYGVMFMMDEFPTLGKMEQFMNGIAYFRGYKVRLFLIVQDTEQLKGIYEESGMNSFLSNSTYRVTFSANNVQTANLISQLVGNQTVEQKSLTRASHVFSKQDRSNNISEVQRALLLPQEVISLPRDEQIILVESSPPIKTQKIKYYEDSYFTERLLPKIDIPQQEPIMVKTTEGDENIADITEPLKTLFGIGGDPVGSAPANDEMDDYDEQQDVA